MATLHELITRGRIFFRRPDWGPDEFIHLLWTREGPDDTVGELCCCRAPADFPDELLDDDQWEPAGTPAREASMATTEIIAFGGGAVPHWQIGGPMEA